jgi:leucyl/phenylalanyl-tRNA--protein transferase
LQVGHFSLLDAQFVTEHLAQFGAHEVSREAYRERLAVALGTVAQFPVELSLSSVVAAMQSTTQTS